MQSISSLIYLEVFSTGRLAAAVARSSRVHDWRAGWTFKVFPFEADEEHRLAVGAGCWGSPHLGTP